MASNKVIKQRQEAGKKATQIKKAIMNNYLVKQQDHNNNNNDKSQDIRSNSEADLDEMNNLSLE